MAKMVEPVERPNARGHIARIPGRGDVVIVSARRITKGRNAGKAEYLLASLEPGGFGPKAYGMRVIGESLLRPAGAPHSKTSVDLAIARHEGTQDDIADRKQEYKEKQREAQGAVNWPVSFGQKLSTERFAPGDIVTIRYSNMERDEELVEINVATGKIAIAALHNKSGKRWVPSTCVVNVKSKQRPLPFEWNADRSELLEQLKTGAKEFHQFRFGAEFIERSYVVSHTRAGARLGSNYECADHTVYQCPDTKLFWRSTGSFD
jgi:hypothetical protein